MMATSRFQVGLLLAAISTQPPSRLGYRLLGAMEGRFAPSRWGTEPSFSKAGTTGSICVKAASYKATSTT